MENPLFYILWFLLASIYMALLGIVRLVSSSGAFSTANMQSCDVFPCSFVFLSIQNYREASRDSKYITSAWPFA
ncbi:hypothetical protein GGR56DRAFT_654234 [Xylariaceae sp. FL0804]|nr:hypothetical protein GGR56DRAFT_654234 [Xylariaceae sp. FL0804]